MGRNLDLAGILDGERAFVGPEMVQIDLTNSCNNNCIGCWCRSPLLGDLVMPEEMQRQTLPLDLVKGVIKDCASMGTSQIYLSGGGEPFLHPHIMDIVRFIKELGLTCHINTNFTLVDEDRASELVKLGVDFLIVSLWAATPETYSRTHPNKSEATFKQLIDTVRYMVRLKNGGPPNIVLYNVIMNLNYHELEATIDLATGLGVDAVEFTVMDAIPGRTDKLLLNEQQQAEVLEACRRIQNQMFGTTLKGGLEVRLSDFMRRVSIPGASKGDYETEMLDRIPCHIGWNFSRIVADGNVNACLKAHRIPVGNIYESSFWKIWNSPEQRHFRRKTKGGTKNDPFFMMIGNDETAKVGCYRGCDDIDRNRRLWNRMQQQTLPYKMLLKGAGYLLRAKTHWNGRGMKKKQGA